MQKHAGQRPVHTRTKTFQQAMHLEPIWKIDDESLLQGRELIRMGWSQPAIDIYETKDRIVARFDMPGVDEEDIKLDIGDDAIRVSAEKRTLLTENDIGYGRIERTQRGYYRILSLPDKIKPKEVEHSYKNGVLEVIAPRVEEIF